MYLNDRQFESVLVEHCQWQDHAHSFIVLPGPGTSSLRCQSRGRTRRTRERPTNPFVCAYLALAAGAEIKINMWHWLKLAVLFCQNLQLGLVLLPAPYSDCGFPALWHPLLHNFNLFSPLLGFFYWICLVAWQQFDYIFGRQVSGRSVSRRKRDFLFP